MTDQDDNYVDEPSKHNPLPLRPDDKEMIPVDISTTTTLKMTMKNMVEYLRRGGAALPEHGQVRLMGVYDDDNIGDQVVTISWVERQVP